MPPGLEPFPLTAAILGIVALIVFPVVRAYKESVEKRLADKDSQIVQIRADCDKQTTELRKDYTLTVERLEEDRLRAYKERDRFIDLAVANQEATLVATSATEAAVTVAERRGRGNPR